MAANGFEAALEDRNEIELTTTGRVSGNQSSRTVWFVERDGNVYLVPVTGADSQWYKNVVKTPALQLSADGAQYSATATPVTDPGMVAQVVDDFRAKYGAQYVADYYPNPNVAVEVPLG
ncbi:MAG TPA: nitroreductase/quinone reductase family protein [Trebonia sp.]|nr:nitroreductase/quinone reductase family protein [Trebonia sp.]